jgi:hypothetical protein
MSPVELANSLEANLERYGPKLSVGEQEWRLIIKALREIERLRDGLRRIKDQDYDMDYSPEGYADAVLTGHEPQKE